MATEEPIQQQAEPSNHPCADVQMIFRAATEHRPCHKPITLGPYRETYCMREMGHAGACK